jgi:transcriptional regulator with XRE-family HTH domain
MSERHNTLRDTAGKEAVVDVPMTLADAEAHQVRSVGFPESVHPANLVRVGRLLKGLREKKGFSQIELATLCGVTSAHISQIEKGRRLPADALCIQLAQHLDCDAVELTWRVRAEKSPETVRMLYGQKHHASTTAPTPDCDPRVESLVRMLQDLRTTIPEARYERLLDTIFGVLSPYGDAMDDRHRQPE